MEHGIRRSPSSAITNVTCRARRQAIRKTVYHNIVPKACVDSAGLVTSVHLHVSLRLSWLLFPMFSQSALAFSPPRYAVVSLGILQHRLSDYAATNQHLLIDTSKDGNGSFHLGLSGDLVWALEYSKWLKDSYQLRESMLAGWKYAVCFSKTFYPSHSSPTAALLHVLLTKYCCIVQLKFKIPYSFCNTHIVA